MTRQIIFLIFAFVSICSIAQKAIIPFEEDGLVYINVSLDKTENTYQFVFDTGASTAVIDSKLAQKLNIKPNAKTYATGASGAQEYEIVKRQFFRFTPDIKIKCQAVLVDLEELTKRTGRPIDGIIGADVLDNFMVHMDFDKSVLKCYDFNTPLPEKKEYKKLALRFENSAIPVIDLDVNLENGKKLKGTFLFDSGANLGLIFNTPYVEKHDLQNAFSKKVSREARGLTTTSVYQQAVVPSLGFGDYSFQEVPIELSESKSGVTASVNVSGILGAAVINKFNYIFDYKKEAFYYAPNTAFKKSFNYPMTGLAFIKKKGKIVVGSVTPNTQAANAGIKEGDEVISVNAVTYENLNEMRAQFQNEGETLEVSFKTKEGEVKKASLLLKRLI